MGTVCGTLSAVPPGGPVNSSDKIQFKNRSTLAVTEASVSDTGQYATSLVVGTYDIGVNSVYSGNTPSSIVVTTLPKYQNISSQNTKAITSADDQGVEAAAISDARSYRLWVVDPVDLAQFPSWVALRQFVDAIEAQGYLAHVERAGFKVAPHNLSHSGACPVAGPHAPTSDWADALIVLQPNTNVTSPPSTTHGVKFVGGGIVQL